MHKLLILLFVSALTFGCSEEDKGMMEKAGEMADDAMESAGEMAEDAAEATKEMAGDAVDVAKEMMDSDDEMKGPEVEALPDWDSLPPIEEEKTVGEKAEEVMDDAVETVKEVVEEGVEKAEEMMKKE